MVPAGRTGSHRPRRQAHDGTDTAKFKQWARWLATFVGFPLAGVAARLVAGNIDGAGAAALGGLAAGGAVLGAVQAGIGGIDARRSGPLDRRDRGRPCRRPRPSVPAAVDYRTDTASLVAMGAISGAAVGLAQALSVPMRTRRPGPLGRGHSRRSGPADG